MELSLSSLRVLVVHAAPRVKSSLRARFSLASPYIYQNLDDVVVVHAAPRVNAHASLYMIY